MEPLKSRSALHRNLLGRRPTGRRRSKSCHLIAIVASFFRSKKKTFFRSPTKKKKRFGLVGLCIRAYLLLARFSSARKKRKDGFYNCQCRTNECLCHLFFAVLGFFGHSIRNFGAEKKEKKRECSKKGSCVCRPH